MNRLITELQRLYFLKDQQPDDKPPSGRLAAGLVSPESSLDSVSGKINVTVDLLDPEGRVRALVVDFARAADWASVATLYQQLVEDLELPAPAISISAQAGYRLWLSLAESVPLAHAQAFLQGLRSAYLPDFPLSQLRLYPPAGEAGNLAAGRPCQIDLVPAMDPVRATWSAFIDPAMGAMFIDAPGLEMAPNMDRQADILSRLACIKAVDFQRALGLLQSRIPLSPETPIRAAEVATPHALLTLNQHFSDPQSFLLAVMNDASASTDQRIQAARALLPFFSAAPGK